MKKNALLPAIIVALVAAGWMAKWAIFDDWPNMWQWIIALAIVALAVVAFFLKDKAKRAQTEEALAEIQESRGDRKIFSGYVSVFECSDHNSVLPGNEVIVGAASRGLSIYKLRKGSVIPIADIPWTDLLAVTAESMESPHGGAFEPTVVIRVRRGLIAIQPRGKEGKGLLPAGEDEVNRVVAALRDALPPEISQSFPDWF